MERYTIISCVLWCTFYVLLIGIVGGVIGGGATTPTVCHILETVRWEFQDGASGYLEERETELMKALRRHIHYKDDCTV